LVSRRQCLSTQGIVIGIVILLTVLYNCRMVKGGWTKNTKVAAVRLDLTVYERLIEAARREGLNINDYLKAMVQERLTAEAEL